MFKTKRFIALNVVMAIMPFATWFNKVFSKSQCFFLPSKTDIDMYEIVFVQYVRDSLGLKVYRFPSDSPHANTPDMMAILIKTLDGYYILVNDHFINRLTEKQQDVIVAHEKGHRYHGHLDQGGWVSGVAMEKAADNYAANIYGANKVSHTLVAAAGIFGGFRAMTRNGRLMFGERLHSLKNPTSTKSWCINNYFKNLFN